MTESQPDLPADFALWLDHCDRAGVARLVDAPASRAAHPASFAHVPCAEALDEAAEGALVRLLYREGRLLLGTYLGKQHQAGIAFVELFDGVELSFRCVCDALASVLGIVTTADQGLGHTLLQGPSPAPPMAPSGFQA